MAGKSFIELSRDWWGIIVHSNYSPQQMKITNQSVTSSLLTMRCKGSIAQTYKLAKFNNSRKTPQASPLKFRNSQSQERYQVPQPLTITTPSSIPTPIIHKFKQCLLPIKKTLFFNNIINQFMVTIWKPNKLTFCLNSSLEHITGP